MTFISKDLQSRLPQQYGQKPPENWQAAQHAAKLANQNDSVASAKQKQQALAEDAGDDSSDDNQNSYFDNADDADEDFDTDDDDSEGGDENFNSGFDMKSKAFDLIVKRVKLWVIGAICPPIGIGAAAISAVLDETTKKSSSNDKF